MSELSNGQELTGLVAKLVIAVCLSLLVLNELQGVRLCPNCGNAHNKHESGTNKATVEVSGNNSNVINIGSDGYNSSVDGRVSDVARALGVNEDTIRRYIPKWIERGEGVYKDESGEWVFPAGFEPYKP